MKYLVGILLVIVGLTIGYIAGTGNYPWSGDEEQTELDSIVEPIHDTIIKTEKIRVPVADTTTDTLSVLSDSLLALIDSLELLIPVDSADEDINIRKEKLISKHWLTVNVIKELEEPDSLISEMMGFSDKMPSKILVEFWESPLSFTGYKLSRSKLVMYGMPAHKQYKLYRNQNKYFLYAETIYYSLTETADFLPYLQVSKDVVFND